MKKKISFIKMSGAGNDFIVVDNYKKTLKLGKAEIAKLCRRRFSIGADGLMLLESTEKEHYDFNMRYFNADGSEAEMCGNGGRCISRFAYLVGRASNTMHFLAKDGPHYAEVKADGHVKLEMIDPKSIKLNLSVKVRGKTLRGAFANTGVPHFVTEVKNISRVDVKTLGNAVRFHKMFAPKGTNVNFVQKKGKDSYLIRTYERGVEDETLACGTGAVAGAVLMHLRKKAGKPVTMHAVGGDLKVYFNDKDGDITKVMLEGNARVISAGYIHEEAFI